MPRRAWVLLAALLTFAVVVMGIIAWAAISGEAGSQRGLVVTTAIPGEIIVRLDDGRTARLGVTRRNQTFVVARDQFPMTVRVTDAQGALLVEDELQYGELADADFRLSVDTNGFFPTSEYRDTPAATP